jgi:hypothetical protein
MRFTGLAPFLAIVVFSACGSNSAAIDSAGRDAAAEGSTSGSSGGGSSGASSGGASSGAEGASPADAIASSSGDGSMSFDAAGCSTLQAAIIVPAPGTVGQGCLPFTESDPTFSGFSETEVSVSTNDPQCKSGLCLVNHFRGRVSCPYGQDAQGSGPGGTPGCKTPNTCAPVTPNGASGSGQTVQAQCADRTAADTVYCSCRCADADGNTSDGGVYCACPGGMTCTPLVEPIGSDPGGSYCIKASTAFDGNALCSTSCDPTAARCP